MECSDKTEACSDNEMISKGDIKEEYYWLEGAVKYEFEEPSVLDTSQQSNSIGTEIKIESWELNSSVKNNVSAEIKYESEEFPMSNANHQNKIESKNNISDEHIVIAETEIKVEPLWWENRSEEIKSESDRPALNDCQENETDIVMDSKTVTAVCSDDQEVDIKIEIKEEPWWLERMCTETMLSKASPDSSQNFQCDIQAAGSSANSISTEDFSAAGSAVLHTEGMDRNGSDLSTPFISASLEKKDAVNSSVSSTNKTNDDQVAKASPVERHMVHFKKNYKCDECWKSFPTPWRLKRHHLIHEGKRPYKCETCGKCFIQKSILQRHYEIHRGKRPHNCEICAFFSHFKAHGLSHNGKEPHKCAVCEKSFTLLLALKKHGLLHGEGETYTCKTCYKDFSLV